MFLFEKLKEVGIILMDSFVRSQMPQSNSCVKKMLKIDLSDIRNLRLVESVNVGSGATLTCNKAKTT